jgi:hypothetical protein
VAVFAMVMVVLRQVGGAEREPSVTVGTVLMVFMDPDAVAVEGRVVHGPIMPCQERGQTVAVIQST